MIPEPHPTVEPLYRDLTSAFTHPFDWMGLLEKPPFWKPRWRKAHKKVAAIFEDHGFLLTRNVAIKYHQQRADDWEFAFTDAGGKICIKLSRALAGQLEP